MHRIIFLPLGMLAAVIVVSMGYSLLPAAATGGATERVNVTTGGVQGGGASGAAISQDGRFVVFSGDELVPEDTNNAGDTYVHDRQTDVTTRVSVASDGTQGNNNSSFSGGGPSISADGRYVAFQSDASNLVPGDTKSHADIFVHDRQMATTTRVSVGFQGMQANGPSTNASISADGRYVAFESIATNLVPFDTNQVDDVFVYDRDTGVTTRVSKANNGTQGNANSYWPSISGDGRFIAFESYAFNLVPGDTNGKRDIFVHDLHKHITTRVSVTSAGAQADDESMVPAISADGRFVAFQARPSNLDPATVGWMDVYVRDRLTGLTTVVSVASDGTYGNAGSFSPSLSADGRHVSFSSQSSNLVIGDDPAGDIFVHDRLTGTTAHVSVASDGTPGNGSSSSTSISGDGSSIAFRSVATNLVPDDTNERGDIFVHDSKIEPTPTPTTCPGTCPTPTQTPTVTPTFTPTLTSTPTSTPEFPDSDGDGCTDEQENGPDETLGGLRDANNPWDFYDVLGPNLSQEKDGYIDLFNDIRVVINNYLPSGYDPGMAALFGPGFMVNYDRGASPPGSPGGWSRSAPDGRIDLFTDIVGVISSAFHDCR